MKTVTVTIDSNGSASVDLARFHGKGCSKVLDDFVGDSKLKVNRYKVEYNETVAEKERVKA